MATFVLVHGGPHGGWCWREVAARRSAEDHALFTPMLTGLGQRAHLARPEVDLFEREDLGDEVLVGHSSGGMVVGAPASAPAQDLHPLHRELACHHGAHCRTRRNGTGWTLLHIDAGHDCMVSEPETWRPCSSGRHGGAPPNGAPKIAHRAPLR